MHAWVHARDGHFGHPGTPDPLNHAGFDQPGRAKWGEVGFERPWKLSVFRSPGERLGERRPSVSDAQGVRAVVAVDVQLFRHGGEREDGTDRRGGEYYVAAELSRRGWLATVTIKNAPGTDALAQDLDSGRVIALQSKTASPGSAFRLNAKDERTTAMDNEWYALVALGAVDERPDFFLVPRNVVATIIYVGHRKWLAEPGRGGRERRDSSMRTIIQPQVSSYREAWDSLVVPTSEVPFVLRSGRTRRSRTSASKTDTRRLIAAPR